MLTLVHACLATYGVQDVEISEDRLLDSICITCIFAQGTSTQGCYIVLLENHDSVATNATGLRIGNSLNAVGCIENLEEGLYHVVVYDIEADGTVDWNSRALFLTAALNWTSPSSEPDQLNTGKNGLQNSWKYSFLSCFFLVQAPPPDSQIENLEGGLSVLLCMILRQMVLWTGRTCVPHCCT